MGVWLAAASMARALAKNSSSSRWNSCCSCCGSSCSGLRKTLAGVAASSKPGLGTREGRGAAGLRARGVCGVLLPEPPDPPPPLPRATHECCPSRSLRTIRTACSSRLWLRARRTGLDTDS